MAFLEKIQTKVEAMAFDRQDWMRHTRNRLCGALGEYAKVMNPTAEAGGL